MDLLHFSNFLSFSMSPLELLIRGTIMYWFLFLLLRFVLRATPARPASPASCLWFCLVMRRKTR